MFLVGVDCETLIYPLRESDCTLYASLVPVVDTVVDPVLFLARVVIVVVVVLGVGTECVVCQTSVEVMLYI